VERARNSRGIRNEQAPPVNCARRSRYEETRKNGEIVEGEKHLTHQERGPLRVDAVEKVRQVVSNVELADVRAQVGLTVAASPGNKLIDMPWKIMSIGTRDWDYRS